MHLAGRFRGSCSLVRRRMPHAPVTKDYVNRYTTLTSDALLYPFRRAPLAHQCPTAWIRTDTAYPPPAGLGCCAGSFERWTVAHNQTHGSWSIFPLVVCSCWDVPAAAHIDLSWGHTAEHAADRAVFGVRLPSWASWVDEQAVQTGKTKISN